tara:strand:+ start:1101 stop:1271 length:171 start_codon:yes stop_codon:yes gene_type:complete
MTRYTDDDPCFKAFSHGGCCGKVTILSYADVTASQQEKVKMIKDAGFNTSGCEESY